MLARLNRPREKHSERKTKGCEENNEKRDSKENREEGEQKGKKWREWDKERCAAEADLDRSRGLDTGSVSGAPPEQLRRNACVYLHLWICLPSVRCICALINYDQSFLRSGMMKQ